MSACLDKHSDEAGFIDYMKGHGYDHVKVYVPGLFFGQNEREFFRKRRTDEITVSAERTP